MEFEKYRINNQNQSAPEKDTKKTADKLYSSQNQDRIFTSGSTTTGLTNK